MTDYLGEAAALLRKAAAINEKENGGNRYSIVAANKGREQIAMKFAYLAAIERGLLPAEMLADLLAHVGGSQVNR